MMKLYNLIPVIIILLLTACDNKTPQQDELADEQLISKASELAQKFLIIDTHIDIPYRLEDEWEDISQSTEKGHFDYPRAVDGGLNAAFLAIYVPAEYEESGGGKELAGRLIKMVFEIALSHPNKFKVAFTTANVETNFNDGVISFPMGMENGTPLEHDIHNLQYFYNQGIRYITLAHSKSNHISDSSYDEEIKWNGLSPFGEEVVNEMNRLGMMVDVSHVTDSSFYDVLRVTKAPVIASHSSCRHFTPGWERNMSDEMIKQLAENGGIIMINFGSSFIDGDVREKNSKHWNFIDSWVTDNNLSYRDLKAKIFIDEYFKDVEVDTVYVSQVADHIDHVVRLVGIDHVGFGSDFDGVRFLPKGLSDASMYHNLIYELLKRGYSDDDIEKVCSGNFLRVWKEVEEMAKRIQLVED
jgi:membrane dipeptidase